MRLSGRSRYGLRALMVIVVSGGLTGSLGCPLGAGSRATTKASAASATCTRPYSASSPWNTPLGAGTRYLPTSAATARALGGPLTSDPTQYTYPVYYAASGSTVPVRVTGRFSWVTDHGHTLRIITRGTVRLPIPRSAEAAAGSDQQIIVLNRKTGSEWGVWHAQKQDGQWSVENGYHYNTHWDGVAPAGFGSRGAGIPYYAGLVTACELDRGRIDHALAFAYPNPTSGHIYPATKSDGDSVNAADIPEGSRLQLDPKLTAKALLARGCRGPCLVIARALQRYGMYLVDGSGRPKLMMEYETTAGWDGRVNANTVSAIPLSAFKVVAPAR